MKKTIKMETKKKILDLGCGTRKGIGSVGVDARDFSERYPEGEFYLCDIDSEPLPFEDNTFDGVKAFHILEHCHNLVSVMEEIWRVSKSNALVNIEVPSEKSVWAWGDPTHCRCFNKNTFYFFVKGHFKNGSEYNFKCDFRIEQIHDEDSIRVLYRVVK